jgi:hypothetical protein
MDLYIVLKAAPCSLLKIKDWMTIRLPDFSDFPTKFPNFTARNHILNL